MATFKPHRIVNQGRQHYPAPPTKVFPLLCPVRESEWLEGWNYEMIWSDSGVAEENCIFSTDFSDVGGREIWVVSRYAPPTAIEFVRFGRQDVVIRLAIQLTAAADGNTTAQWRRVCTGLTPEGNAYLLNLDAGAFEMQMRVLERTLSHYLTSGEMLRGVTSYYRHDRQNHADNR
jgi:hypothetical protein